MKVFITGTDTGIGKTYVSRLMLKNWNDQGLQTIGLKPVSSGCEWIDGQYINQDAYLLQHAASICLTYEQVNPYCFTSRFSLTLRLKEKRKINRARNLYIFKKLPK
jgi:dethiobiotin synthase